MNKPLRIGEVAELTGTTPRTIRYYEEIGLLRGADRAHGKHRAYSEADVERLREIVRLKELLGLSLEQLSQLLEAEAARAELRREYHRTDNPQRRKTILEQALAHISTQLKLVRGRRDELERLEHELIERTARIGEALSTLAAR
ncbi:MAG: MerR family transcriptional regulator [Solirubrobacteraceae bacterium]